MGCGCSGPGGGLWSGFVGRGDLLEVDTEIDIRDFQSPDLGDGITVRSFTRTDSVGPEAVSGKQAAVVNSRVRDACGERTRSRCWLMSAWVWSLEMTSFLICLPFEPETQLSSGDSSLEFREASVSCFCLSWYASLCC